MLGNWIYIYGYFWDIFITAAPTISPSMRPSMSPSSFIPSSVPTITGAISSVSMSGTVTADISIIEIAGHLAEIYGVDSNDVEASVDYITSGTLDVTIPEEIPDSEAITAFVESISDILGIHERNVAVTIDENGIVNYSVMGENYEDIQGIQSLISEDEFVFDIRNSLNERDSGISVGSNTSNDDIEALISATIDTSDATGTVDIAEEISSLTQDYGLMSSNVEGTSIN